MQLGGGIRTIAHIESWLGRGLARVILGTVAVRDPALVQEAAAACSPARSRSASTRAAARSRSRAGPRPRSSIVIELAKRFEGAGVAAIIYTDIDRDGILAGINWESTLDLARARRASRSSPRAVSPRWTISSG